MIELTTKLIGVSIDSSFVQPRPFAKERLDQIGLRALDSFKANGLQPEHIGLRTVDVLFGYELNFTLFGGSTTFRLTGAHLILNFQNILNRDALRIVAETASRAHSLFEETEFLEHAIGVAAHLSFRDEQEEKNANGFMQDPVGRSNSLAASLTSGYPSGNKRFVSKSIGPYSFHPASLCRGILAGAEN